MSLLKKIVIIGVVLASVAVVGVNVAQAAISAGCRADISTCTSAELTEYITELTTTLNALQLKVAELGGEEAATGTPAACTGITFTRNLSQGMSGNDVKCLQALLNQSADTQVATSGAGSAGNETINFGPLTKAAVIEFQEKNAATILTPLGLTAGTGYVGEKTRAKLTALLAAAPEEEEEEEEEEEVVSGLKVAINKDTPAAASVPINTSNILFTSIDFTAGTEGDVVVNTITVTRTGLGADANVEGVTLYDGNEKLSSTRNTFNSAHQMAFNITGGWEITAGDTKTLSIRAKLVAAGTYNALGIASAGDVVLAEGDVSGTFPVYGYQMTGVNVNVATVTIDGEGVAAQNKKVGVDNVTLASFSLRNDAIEDVTFDKIVLKNKGTASDSDIANVTLMQGAEVLTGPVLMVRDYVTLVLDEPYTIKKSDRVIFKVVGDIETGLDHTVEFILNNDIDLVCTGKTYGYAAIVDRDGFDDVAEGNTTETTILGAEINTNLASTAKETPDEVLNVVFGTLELTASAEDTRITNLVITMEETDGDADILNNEDIDELELVDTADGSAYAGVMTGGGNDDIDDETWTFDDEIYFIQGVKRSFEIRGDLPIGIGNNDQYNVFIDTADIEAEGVVSGDTIDDFSVDELTGKKVTVKTADLTILSSPMAAGDSVIDAKDVVLFTGLLSAGPASDITVDRMRFEAAAAGDFDIDNISRAVLYTGDGNVEQVLSSTELNDGEADFSALNIRVPKGSANAVVFGVKVDIKHTLDLINDELQIQLDTVSARDSDGDEAIATDETGAAIEDGNELGTARLVTLHGVGTLKVSMPVTDAEVKRDRYTLADTVTDWIGKIKVRAENEAVVIKDLWIQNETANDEDSVKTVSLYKADKTTLVGVTTLLGTDLAIFDDINYTVAVGTEYLYIKSDLRKIGTGALDTADSSDALSLRVVTIVAEGENSGEELDENDTANADPADGEYGLEGDADGFYDDAQTTYTQEFAVVGTRVSAIDLVSSASGKSIASSLSDGVNSVAIVKVVTNTTTNTDDEGTILKTVATQILLNVSNSVGLVINGMTIERIGGSGNVDAMDITDPAAPFILDDDWIDETDAQVESGVTAYYLVKADLTLQAVRDYIQVALDDLNAGDATANLRWSDQLTPEFSTLRLDYTSVDGVKILEPLE